MKCMYFLFLLLITSCTATRLTSSWTAPMAGNKQYKRIMVVSTGEVTGGMTARKMEKHLSEDLKLIGYDAVCYSELFKDGELKYLRYDSVRKKLIDNHVEGVITIALMATEKESVYVKDKESSNSQNNPMGSFWESPRTVKQDIGKRGYYLSTTHYYWQSHFYDVSSIDLLYTAQSAAFEVSSIESMAHKYGKMIVDDMQKKYLLIAMNNKVGN